MDTSKVSNNKVYIFFVADRNHTDLYSFDGAYVRSHCKMTYNGKIYCYCVPMELLVNEGELPQELISYREQEYNKFKAYKEKQSKKN